MRRVVFTGFGTDIAGEGMLNSFRWGMDNRYHISTGLDGGSVRRGDRAAAKTVSVRGYGLLLDPRGETFELTGGGGQYGMSLDDWGRTYVCGNSEPFNLVTYDSRYIARNPYLRAPAAAVNVAPAGKFTRLYRISPVEPWRALRTRMRTQGLFAGSDEGGKPSGFFTGATGVTVYRGDAFPAEFHGNLFVGEVSNNLIHRAIPEPRGVLVTARDAEPGREFIASRDCYFRPAMMANAPDGCLWVVDICRELIEGRGLPAPADPQAHGCLQRRRSRPDLADRARRTSSPHRPAEQGRNGRAGRAAGTPQWLASRHGLAAVVPAARSVGGPGAAPARLRFGAARRPRPCPGRACRPGGARAGRCPGRPGGSRPARLRARPAARGAVLPGGRADFRPDDGDGRRSRSDGPLSARVLTGCIAGHAGRRGISRPGAPRRVRSLDADGDPELGDDLHRRGLHPPGRRRRLPGLGARACLPDGPGRADRRGGPRRRPGRDHRDAGRPAGRRAGPGAGHRSGLDGR